MLCYVLLKSPSSPELSAIAELLVSTLLFSSTQVVLKVLILISVVSTFCWDLHRKIIVIMYYTVILCHKLVFLVLV